jgi:hypothetical protein
MLTVAAAVVVQVKSALYLGTVQVAHATEVTVSQLQSLAHRSLRAAAVAVV